MKIHSDFKLFAGVHFDSSRFLKSPAYGVDRFMLDRIGTEQARATTIVKYMPNSRFPEHTHIGGEEFVVLEGTFKDEHGEFPAGTYVRNPIGSRHSPWVDDDGCTIFVKLLQMADTQEGTAPLYVEFESTMQTHGKATVYGSILDLYRNGETGEMVQICWVNANEAFPCDSLSIDGGEELFILDGSLILASGEVFGKWGWLRFPVGAPSNRPGIKTGTEGARIFRKTGHLTDKALAMEKIQITEEG